MATPKKIITRKPVVLPKRTAAQPSGFSLWTLTAKIALAVAAFLVPLVVGTWTPDHWEIHKAVVVVAAVTIAWLCYFIGQFKKPDGPWHWHPLDWLVLGLGLTSVMGTVTSVNWWSSLAGIQGVFAETLPVTIAGISIYILSVRLFRTSADRLVVWSALLAGVGFSMLLQLFQLSGTSLLPGSLATEALFSTIANSSLQVALCAAAVSTIGFFLWPKAKEGWAKVCLAALIALGWLVLFFMSQAVGWAVFALGMIIVVLTQSSQQQQTSSRLVLVVVALAAAGMLSQFFKLTSYTSLPSTREFGLQQSVSAETAMNTISKLPVLGTGPSTWYDAFVQYRPESYNNDARWGNRYIRSGAEWSQLLATQGIAGLLLWIGVFSIAGWEFWRQGQRKSSFTLKASLFVIGLFMLTAVFSTWSLVLVVLFWFALGLGRSKLAATEPSVSGRVSPIPALGFALTVILGIAFWYPAIRTYASQVVYAKAQLQVDEQASMKTLISTLQSATKLDSHNVDAGVLLANAYARKIQDDLAANDITSAQQSLQLATATARIVVQRNPKNPAAYEAENNLLNNLVNYLPNPEVQANENFKALRRLEPANPIHDVGYGQTLLVIRARAASDTTTASDAKLREYLNSALNAFQEALRKKPDYLQAKYARAEALTTDGQYQAALMDLNELVQASPSVSVFWAAQGTVLAQVGKLDESKASFEQALTIDGTDVNTYLAYSQVLQDAKKTDDAKAVLERGLKAIPGDTDLTAALKKLTS